MTVLPAYAGMIPARTSRSCVRYGAPRVCGDDPQAHGSAYSMDVCSPRMRG